MKEDFAAHPTRILFFTGKGGVGKTSLACATAVGLADQGKKVLLVCTDPASNLHDVLGSAVGTEPTPVTGVANLQALNIDPEAAASQHREDVVGPYRGVLPDTMITRMEEELSGACTMEIAAFDAFARLLGDPAATADYDHLLFDTAPTGHTLRLLQLPSAWNDFISTNTTGTSCLGPLSGLQQQQALYQQVIANLSNQEMTTIVLVCRPDQGSMAEAARTGSELRELGIAGQQLVINGVFTAATDDPLAAAWQRENEAALGVIPPPLRDLPSWRQPMLAHAPMGIPALRALFAGNSDWDIEEIEEFDAAARIGLPAMIDELLLQLGGAGRGVIMTMGKGGVGKTTLASVIAVHLARQGHPVLLATTDPAAHLDAGLAERYRNLTVHCIDPAAATETYRQRVIQEAGAALDDNGRRLLAEDLRSPCTEEIAVFQAFARLVDQGKDGFVVVDTAPTGHTLLLLDAAQAYHREVSRSLQELPAAVLSLLPRLRDPQFTRVLIVTLPETTPIHEAMQLQHDLRRAEITPFAWIVNQCLAPLTVSDPLLQARQRQEWQQLAKLSAQLGGKLYLAPWKANREL
jgi:arsenite/tail-anchored protein-transporting ATPase